MKSRLDAASAPDPDTVEELLVLLRQHTELARYTGQMNVMESWERELAKPRNQEPKRLVAHGYKVFSQNDEDGIIAEIFRRIGTYDLSFVEFGVEVGTECNTVKLLVEGWHGLWIEANPWSDRQIRENFAPFLDAGRLAFVESMVTAENIDSLIGGAGLRGEVDLLSIDIDYNDYWVWNAISVVSPRVVAIEYNASLRPPMSVVVPYRPDAKWDGSNFYGASLEALVRLGQRKGYRLVGCSLAGVNAFFVRADLCGEHFLEPATAEAHYEPARHYLHLIPSGHRSRPGPWVAV